MSTSNTQLSYAREVAFGVNPEIAMTKIRNTGDTLTSNPSSDTSKEIRADRMVTDSILLDIDAAGDINCDLSHGNSDDFKESAFADEWSTPMAVSNTDISAESADDSFNSVSGEFTAVKGQWIKIGGFVEPALNGFFHVTTATATKLIVDVTLADEGVGPTVTCTGSMLRNGTTRHSYLIEREHERITQFLSWAGMVVGNYKLNLASGAVVTEVFSFVGKNETLAQVTVGTGAPVDAPTESRMAATVNVADLRENGVLVSGVYFQELSFDLGNAATAKKAIANLGSVDVELRTISLTGSLTPYFENEVLYEKFADFTLTSLSWKMEKAGKAYICTIPALRFTSGDIPCGSLDADEIVSLSWTAERDSDTNCMIQLDSFV